MRKKIANNNATKRAYNRKQPIVQIQPVEPMANETVTTSNNLGLMPMPNATNLDKFIKCSELIRTYNIESNKLLADLIEKLNELK